MLSTDIVGFGFGKAEDPLEAFHLPSFATEVRGALKVSLKLLDTMNFVLADTLTILSCHDM